ncbi:MAG: substrate-binding domain-containing protein, partial [Clostridia bacterium]|nr:substrate-binding domain-containing protein [Clostridia bacterium]
EKARELGYVGSQAARALASGDRTVGIYLPKGPEEVLARYRAGIAAARPALSAYGITLTEREPADGTEGLDGVLAVTSLLGHLSLPAEVPLVTVGSRAHGVHPVAEVTADYRIGGRLSAQFLAFATAGAPVAILSSRRTSYAEEEAIRGFREISQRLGIRLAAIAECGDGAQGVRTELRRLLATNRRIGGLFVTAPLVGTLSATLADLRQRPTVIGIDFTAPATEALRAGTVAALLYTSPERQVERALLYLADHLTTRREVGHTTVRTELVLRSNLENYL